MKNRLTKSKGKYQIICKHYVKQYNVNVIMLVSSQPIDQLQQQCLYNFRSHLSLLKAFAICSRKNKATNFCNLTNQKTQFFE